MRISFDLDDKLTCYVEPAMLCQSPVEAVGQQLHQPSHQNPASRHVDTVLATANGAAAIPDEHLGQRATDARRCANQDRFVHG